MTETSFTASAANRGALWAALTQVLSKGSVVISTLVLARILAPADFGLFAVGMLVVNYVDRVKDLGVGAALVYRNEPWRVLSGTGFSLALMSSGTLAVGTFLLAPVAAEFFGEQDARDLIRVLAVVLLLSGLSIVPESQMRRALDFRRRMVPETLTAIVKGATSVALAVAGFGVWSLVWGQVAGVLTQTVLYWALSDWRPHLGWDRRLAGLVLRFGIPTSAVAVFAVVQENLDYLVVGRRLGTEQLGYYSMAFRIPELTVLALCIVASQVLFPILSRLQDDREAMGRTYLATARFITSITTAATVLLACLAAEVIQVAYGEGWAPAVPALRLIALFMLVYALGFHTGEVFKATGRPGLLNWFALLKVLALAPTLWVLAGVSIAAVAGGMAVVHLVIALAELAVVARLLHLSPRRVVGQLVPTLLAGAVLAGVTLAAVAALGEASVWVRLVTASSVGTMAWLAALRVLAPDVVTRGLGLLATVLPARSTKEAP